MKKTLRSPLIAIPFALMITLILARFVVAAEKKEARVTQVVHDVRLLTSRTASRPASVSDNVREGTAIRTGTDSRAELTFPDQSLTRLGANTVFSFGPGAHDFQLNSGAILLAVPKEAGTARVSTAAVTAAISGGIAMGEAHPKSWFKWVVIEGQGVVTLKSTGETIVLYPGQIVTLPPGIKKFTKPQNIDLKKLTDKSLLIRSGKLPDWVRDLIQMEVEKQEGSTIPGGLKDPTGFDAISQKSAAEKAPTPTHTPRPPG
jgi:mannose-6-phosphate isomerase-like protein (cupin superfamily)